MGLQRALWSTRLHERGVGRVGRRLVEGVVHGWRLAGTQGTRFRRARLVAHWWGFSSALVGSERRLCYGVRVGVAWGVCRPWRGMVVGAVVMVRRSETSMGGASRGARAWGRSGGGEVAIWLLGGQTLQHKWTETLPFVVAWWVI